VKSAFALKRLLRSGVDVTQLAGKVVVLWDHSESTRGEALWAQQSGSKRLADQTDVVRLALKIGRSAAADRDFWTETLGGSTLVNHLELSSIVQEVCVKEQRCCGRAAAMNSFTSIPKVARTH
jgi:hypothetical protein